MKTRALLGYAVCWCALTAPSWAADWPQWRGPDRTDISKETGLLKSWPEGGPKLLWTNDDAGLGYSGPAIVGERLYTMGGREEQEYVYALDVKTGKQVWASKLEPLFKNNWGGGPRSTPTVDGDRLYVLGPGSELACLAADDGKILWSKNLLKDLHGQLMSGWGFAESPLVDGEHLICSPGGQEGTLAALDKKTGAVLWRSQDVTDPAAYSSAVAAEVGGVRQYVQLTGKSVLGVAADDGRLLWRVEQPYRTAVIPTPIFHDNYVYTTAGYGAGCNLLKLSAEGNKGTKEEEVYSNKNMENKHGGVVLVDGHIYGWTDHGGGAWICQDAKTGDVVWQSKKLGRGSVTCADGLLYCYSERDGTCVLIEASPEGWKEKGRFAIPEQSSIRSPSGGVWTHPVVANGRLYLRDQNLLFCYDISGARSQAKP
jgi:outer membrane protein assembly factor BamB